MFQQVNRDDTQGFSFGSHLYSASRLSFYPAESWATLDKYKLLAYT